MKTKLKVTLMRSKFGRKPGHRECVEGLGLHKTYSSVVVEDNPCIRGMITKASYLLKVEEVGVSA